jgi:succinate--hydroxymethylglutarate CoA-transferase
VLLLSLFSHLALYRADVIKIEHPKGGDDTRAWGPPFAENKDEADTTHGESAYFLCANRNKKSVTVNMKSEGGRQLLHDLVRQSDILVENYLPGKLESMGLGYEELAKINPKLIYASITGKSSSLLLYCRALTLNLF